MDAVAPYVLQISLWAVPILLAVVLHELAHGYVAFRLGDSTAARRGRLTLNPFAHVDLFGTIILPLVLVFGGAPFVFGYAKPVPVNFANLRNPRRDMVLVALAGPMTNLVLAGISAVTLHTFVSPTMGENATITTAALLFMLHNSVLMNVGLAVFNLLPIPPLDGGRVATGLLPRSPAMALAQLEPYGMLIIMALLMTGTLDHILRPMKLFLLQALL